MRGICGPQRACAAGTGASDAIGWRPRIRKLPDIHLKILDLIREDDRVVVRDYWMGVKASGNEHEFSEIVIAPRQLVER